MRQIRVCSLAAAARKRTALGANSNFKPHHERADGREYLDVGCAVVAVRRQPFARTRSLTEEGMPAERGALRLTAAECKASCPPGRQHRAVRQAIRTPRQQLRLSEHVAVMSGRQKPSPAFGQCKWTNARHWQRAGSLGAPAADCARCKVQLSATRTLSSQP